MSGALRWTVLAAVAGFLAVRPAASPAGDSGLPLAPWFKSGEELIYRIYWGILRVGASRIRAEWVEFKGRRLIAIRYLARTNALFDAIYPVDDFAETLLDPETFLPVRYRCVTRRWRKVYDETILFDYAAGTARAESKSDRFARDWPIAPPLRDVISFLYLLRTHPLGPSEERHSRFLGGAGPTDVRLAARGEAHVDLPLYGKTACVRIEPSANFAGFLIEGGRVMAWVSTDARRLCTRLEIRGTIADVNIVLCEVSGPGDDPWITVPKARRIPSCLRDVELSTNDCPAAAGDGQAGSR
jgi:hypothetical protein